LTQAASIEIRPSGTLAQLTGSLDLRVETSDPVVRHLAVCLETARARPSEMMSVCVDHIVLALQAYLRCTQNNVSPHPGIARGGLAPWQLLRAQEILASRLDETVPLAELAQACKLSPGHFARAFKQTTGKPPHHWLMDQRIEKAKNLMVDTALPLAEIAISCGFADQSHFTRVFSRSIQSSPGAWRRFRRAASLAA
jgi:AraC family transcriptional regulator